MRLILYMLGFFLLATPSVAQGADCPVNTGNNGTIFLRVDGVDLHPGEAVYAVNEIGSCVGYADAPSSPEYFAVTVWGDDEITPAVDGLLPLEQIRLERRQKASVTLDPSAPYRVPLTYNADALWHVTEAAFDTLTTQRMDSLLATLVELEGDLDSLFAVDSTIIATLEQTVADQAQTITDQQANLTDLQAQLLAADARGDSLQAIVDAFPDVSALQARITELEAEIVAVNADLTTALGLLARVYLIINRQGNKYRELCDALPGAC